MKAASSQTADANRLDVLTTLVQRQLRLRTKRSMLGLVWPIASPFLLMALYVFVFRSVFRVPIPRYPDFLLCGLLPWAYLTFTLNRSITSISTDPELVRKIGPRCELLPLTEAVTGSLYFVITIAIFAVTLAARGELPVTTLPVVVLPVLATVLVVASLALAVSLIDVYNHDVRIVFSNALTVWFFLLPGVYRAAMAPSGLHFLQSVDPMNLIIGQMRDLMYLGQINHPEKLVEMVLLAAALFAGTLWMFRRLAVDLPKDV
ncbi:MAG: lipopolysaccharide transport system permease protein [Acidimicrobiaceae bacterium]|jgi:ABC-type polysaccharide/polyol phosphate export permease